ncbi:TraR/DksA C4-type zinc finger protein [Shewanella baltica]|uniref:TraR/DksA C4-type zinc finger protein n=1 Tax=Shewanella baltica TaxID=62322 RepID=UPI0021F9997F|nr:TraR/DksA C4-type zinc finger protein [Shewanella baltica]MCS6115242.1 conjugal transfer protein TraR [Shewanella baltica]UVW63718.1 conjugal transfer protein TraR [Shewanella baltica]
MDAVDLVTREQLRAEHRFEQQRKALAAKPVPQSATECAECGNEIPEGRRKAILGVRLCVTCQTWRES